MFLYQSFLDPCQAKCTGRLQLAIEGTFSHKRVFPTLLCGAQHTVAMFLLRFLVITSVGSLITPESSKYLTGTHGRLRLYHKINTLYWVNRLSLLTSLSISHSYVSSYPTSIDLLVLWISLPPGLATMIFRPACFDFFFTFDFLGQGTRVKG